MSTDKKKAARRALVAGKAIPLGELFRRSAGGERNARLALADPKTPPELRAELERYLADPVGAVLDDGAKERDEARGMIASAASTALAPYRGGRAAGVANKRTERVRAHIVE